MTSRATLHPAILELLDEYYFPATGQPRRPPLEVTLEAYRAAGWPEARLAACVRRYEARHALPDPNLEEICARLSGRSRTAKR
jgi:hypothetical protein